MYDFKYVIKNIFLMMYFLFAVYLKRVIVHPSFKNVSFKEAEKALETMEQGDVIIRPSSKVCNFTLLLSDVFKAN